MSDAILPPNTADRVRKIFAVARQSAAQFHHEQVLPEHVLLALVKEGGGVGANVLRNLDVDLRKLRIELERRMPNGARPVSGPVPFSTDVRSVVERAKARPHRKPRLRRRLLRRLHAHMQKLTWPGRTRLRGV